MRKYGRKQPVYKFIEGVHELCRLCLKKCDEGKTVPIFTDESGNITASLALRITICVGLEMVNEEKLPNMMCSTCHMDLEKYYEFRKRCEVSYCKLKSHLLADQMQKMMKIDELQKHAQKTDGNHTNGDGQNMIMINVNDSGLFMDTSSLNKGGNINITTVNLQTVLQPISQVAQSNRVAQSHSVARSKTYTPTKTNPPRKPNTQSNTKLIPVAKSKIDTPSKISIQSNIVAQKDLVGQSNIVAQKDLVEQSNTFTQSKSKLMQGIPVAQSKRVVQSGIVARKDLVEQSNSFTHRKRDAQRNIVSQKNVVERSNTFTPNKGDAPGKTRLVVDIPVAQSNIVAQKDLVKQSNTVKQSDRDAQSNIVAQKDLVDRSSKYTPNNGNAPGKTRLVVDIPVSQNNIVAKSNKVAQCSATFQNKLVIDGRQTDDCQTVGESEKIAEVLEDNNLQVEPSPKSEADVSGFLSAMLLELGILTRQEEGLLTLSHGTMTLELETEDGNHLTLELMEEDEEQLKTSNLNVEDGKEKTDSTSKSSKSRIKTQRSSSNTKKCQEENGNEVKSRSRLPGGDGAWCSICSRGFCNRSVLARHERGVHARARPYECGVCARTFSQRSVLDRHEMVHSDFRPFKCPECDKGFTQRRSLEMHLRTHKPPQERQLEVYQCSICPRRFLHSSGLSRHMTSHNGRLYRCASCGRQFTDKSSLRRHARTAHDTKRDNEHSDEGEDS